MIIVLRFQIATLRKSQLMGNQSFSVCERQNHQQTINRTIQKQAECQKTKKVSLQNYKQSVSNKSLHLKSQTTNKNKQFIKISEQILKIYDFLMKKQPINPQHINIKQIQTSNEQNLKNKQLNQSQDLKILINHQNKIYLKRESNHFQYNYDRNSKHLVDQKNQDQQIDFFDQEYKNYLNNLNIFDQQYFIQHKNNQNLNLNGSFQLYSVKTDENQKYIKIQFQNGLLKSKDAIIITNKGNYYRGGFYNNQFNEKGLLHFQNGVQMKGIFKDGFLQGKGQKIEKDGGHFQGMFKKGKKQGKGQILWKQNINQNISNITFSQKKYFQPREIYFEGFFKEDKMNGLGHLITPNYEYWGPFVDNMKQGKGTMIFFPQKTKFEGWFQKDQILGYGVKYFTNGTIQKGYFGKESLN